MSQASLSGVTKRRVLTPMFIKDIKKSFDDVGDMAVEVFEDALTIQKS